MGRPKKQSREPFWREARGAYYVQQGTRQTRLSPDKDEAWRLWHELMSRPAEAEKPNTVAAPAPTLVVELLDAFLEWVSQNRAARTHAWYQENIQRFVDRIPATLTIAELKTYHVTRALAHFPHWSNNTKHDFISAIKRAISWADEEDLIDRSPLAQLKKPAREAREMAISPTQYAEILSKVTEPNFRELLELSWETGARLQELRKLESRFFDPESQRVVFPPLLTKGKKYYRVIYLTPYAVEILTRLAVARPDGPLLVNSDGKAWNKNAVNSAFCRLKKKIGIKYHLGAFRKGYATEALKNGVDTVTLGHLLGHRDPSMVSKVYGMVQQDPIHMADSVKKARRKPETT